MPFDPSDPAVQALIRRAESGDATAINELFSMASETSLVEDEGTTRLRDTARANCFVLLTD